MRAIFTALPITSAGRFSPLGPVGTWEPLRANLNFRCIVLGCPLAEPGLRLQSIITHVWAARRVKNDGTCRRRGQGAAGSPTRLGLNNCTFEFRHVSPLHASAKHTGTLGLARAASRAPKFKLRHYPAARIRRRWLVVGYKLAPDFYIQPTVGYKSQTLRIALMIFCWSEVR